MENVIYRSECFDCTEHAKARPQQFKNNNLARKKINKLKTAIVQHWHTIHNLHINQPIILFLFLFSPISPCPVIRGFPGLNLECWSCLKIVLMVRYCFYLCRRPLSLDIETRANMTDIYQRNNRSHVSRDLKCFTPIEIDREPYKSLRSELNSYCGHLEINAF